MNQKKEETSLRKEGNELEKGQRDANHSIRHLKNDESRFFLAFLLQRILLAPFLWFYYRILNRVEIIGIENLKSIEGDSFMICPNHTSSFDSWVGTELMFTSLRNFFSREYYLCVLADLNRLGPLFFMKLGVHCGVIPVDRFSGLEQYGMVDTLRLILEKKRKIIPIIYPEGTRSKSGRLAEKYKGGAGWLVAQGEIPVLPLYHVGFNQLPGSGRKLKIIFGKPLVFKEFFDKKNSPTSWIKITSTIMGALKTLENEHHPEAILELKTRLERERGLQFLPQTPFNQPLAEVGELPAPQLDPIPKGGWVLKGAPPIPFLLASKISQLNPPGSLKSREVYPVQGFLPPQNDFHLGNPHFSQAHRSPFNLGVSPLPMGISGPQMVSCLSKRGIPSFLGTYGLSLSEIKKKILETKEKLGNGYFGVECCFDPFDPDKEWDLVLFLKEQKIQSLWASHYLKPTSALAYFSWGEEGQIPGKPPSLFYQTLRPLGSEWLKEVQNPENYRKELGSKGFTLPEFVSNPLITDLVYKGDGSGLTEKGPLFQLMEDGERIRIDFKKWDLKSPRIGLSGGQDSPACLVLSFHLGADFVMTGSINQWTKESDLAWEVKKWVGDLKDPQHDYCPTLNYKERNLKLQLIKHGSLCSVRIQRWSEFLIKGGGAATEIKNWYRRTFQKEYSDWIVEAKERLKTLKPGFFNYCENHPQGDELVGYGYYLYQSLVWAVSGDLSRRPDWQIWSSSGIGAGLRILKNNIPHKGGKNHLPGVVELQEILISEANRLVQKRQLNQQGFHLLNGD